MLGVEFSRPDTGRPYPEAARQVRDRCFSQGLLCELGGRSDATLRLLPPLNVSERHTREALDILVPAIESTSRL
jgi:diaminobutyrate-2-oxoglutarate transaminase